MHRTILGVKKGVEVDHRDGNGLNNQRRNLRRASKSQNQAAYRGACKNKSSRFRGVRWASRYNNWTARITVNGREMHLGCFGVEVSAAAAYNRAAKKYFGRFASLNEI